MNAGLQLMLGHQVEVSAFVGHRVFAAEISHGIEFVISLGFADLHGFQRRPVYADTHLHAGRGIASMPLMPRVSVPALLCLGAYTVRQISLE